MRYIVSSLGFQGRPGRISTSVSGLDVFPRLLANEHSSKFSDAPASTGAVGLDVLLGGGLVPGTNTLLIGPSGAGKTTTATRAVLAALERGERAAYFLFDKGMRTLLTRTADLGMDLASYLEAGRLTVRQIGPAELLPGEFASLIRDAVDGGVHVIVIDSLNAYLQAVPGKRHLLLQMHELLSYLNQRGVVTLMVLGQHGLVGETRTDLDFSYLADSIVLLRYFEGNGEVRKAISVVKTRTAGHERTIREFWFDQSGVQVGEPLPGFGGVFSGTPTWTDKAAGLLHTAGPASAS